MSTKTGGTIWVLVAERSRARIFESRSSQLPVSKIMEFNSPDAKLQTHDLVSDRPGRIFSNASNVRHSTSSREEPNEHLADLFSKEIADFLRKERSLGHFQDLILVAEPGFLGKLRQAIDKSTEQTVIETLHKDYSHFSDQHILKLLEPSLGEIWSDPKRWAGAVVA